MSPVALLLRPLLLLAVAAVAVTFLAVRSGCQARPAAGPSPSAAPGIRASGEGAGDPRVASSGGEAPR